MTQKYVNELFNFIASSPTCFHNVALVKSILNSYNYQELKESTTWPLEKGKNYYVIRDDASIIAFKIPNNFEDAGFNIVASHNDSPTFKIKPEGCIENPNYKRLNTEPYGGMILSTWFDRPLSIAGRVIIKKNNEVSTRLVNLSGHDFIIPNVAIHLTRSTNPLELNTQNDLLPVIGLTNEENSFSKQLKKASLLDTDEVIIAHDLFLYNKEVGTTIGLNQELIASPKLDDLECAFSSLEAFLQSKNENNINVCAIFDNEEVGSGSNHGAASTFLTDVLERICASFNMDKHKTYALSMLVSADNAHAVHPAHPEKSDPTNCVYLNKGIVIKYHSGLSYTTDAISAGIFKTICDNLDVPYQDYTNRSDMRGGSTLGHIALEKLSITSVDIGLAQLAMHSSFETAGSKDIYYMVKGLKGFYDSTRKIEGSVFIIK